MKRSVVAVLLCILSAGVGIQAQVDRQTKILNSIHTILAQPDTQGDKCPDLCNNLSLGVEYEAYGTNDVTCGLCSSTCAGIARGRSTKALLAARARRSCTHNTIPMNLQLSSEQLSRLRPLIKQLGEALRAKDITVISLNTVEKIQQSEKAITGAAVSQSDAQNLLAQETAQINQLLSADLPTDAELNEVADVLSSLEVELQASKYDAEVNALAYKLKNALADIAQQQAAKKKITPEFLKEMRANLKKVYTPAPAPANINKAGQDAFNAVIDGLRSGFITFGIVYTDEDGSIKNDEESTGKIQAVISQLQNGLTVNESDAQFFASRIAKPGLRVIVAQAGTSYPKTVQQRAVKRMADLLNTYRTAYIGLKESQQQKWQQQKLDPYLKWDKKYTPEEFTKARKDFDEVLKSLKNKDITAQAKKSGDQAEFDIIENTIESKKDLTKQQKRTFLDDIKEGNFTLKATPEGNIKQANEANSLVAALRDEIIKHSGDHELEEAIVDESEGSSLWDNPEDDSQ
ncbi:MAG: hypothetical protein WD068_00975 [Candidatus Babeliales bacterium]